MCSDEEWAFVLPCLLLSREDSAHREHDLRAVFNGVRYIADGQPVAVYAARSSAVACDRYPAILSSRGPRRGATIEEHQL